MSQHTNRPEVVFTMGLPASGKSSVSKAIFPTHKMIDCDSIKESHANYDPKDPQALHAWSKTVAQAQFDATLSLGLQNVVYDTTGTNAPRMSRLMMKTARMGFKVSLVFVTVPLSVSIERNANRPRVVPQEVIMAKAQQVTEVFHQIKNLAHSVQVIDNSVFNQDLA